MPVDPANMREPMYSIRGCAVLPMRMCGRIQARRQGEMRTRLQTVSSIQFSQRSQPRITCVIERNSHAERPSSVYQ